MSGRGRPLRFVALVAVAWIGGRTALLWNEGAKLEEAVRRAAGLPPGAPALPGARRALSSGPPTRGSPGRSTTAPRTPPAAVPAPPSFPAEHPLPRDLPDAATLAPPPPGTAPPAMASLEPDRLAPLPRRRWSASAWAVARPGTGIGAAPGGGQIGGSQAGLRIAWRAVPEARVALFGRVTTPLRGAGREAALGIEWQPLPLPVRLVAEQRLGLDSTPGGPGIGVVGGGAWPVAARFRLETYAQGGFVRRTRTEPYADGAIRLTRDLAGSPGAVRLALGAGTWGAAQRDAARLDIGPVAELALPLSGTNLRFALDWRQRVAGSARPGSGPALTLGADL